MTTAFQPDQRESPRQSLIGARLSKHADYQRAYAASRKRQSASMSWFLAPQAPSSATFEAPNDHPVGEDLSPHPNKQRSLVGDPESPGTPIGPRVGLTAGKVLGKAHERNRIKRRMREALRRHVELLPAGCDLILHPRRAVLTMEFAKLEGEIVRILNQAKAEAARMTKAHPSEILVPRLQTGVDQPKASAQPQAAAPQAL
ncbi:MAG: ribonuclease P protein component [Terracidiphilus sp.]|jgi:ribonuclease P protein component